MTKTRKEKMNEYMDKYAHIPKDYNDRLMWMINKINLSSNKMDEIIEKKRNIEASLRYFDYKIVLYENPEGAERPRFRLVNAKNYMNMAIQSKNFVHVYSPNANNDHRYIHRLIDQELIQLNQMISTPMQVCINVYFKTPTYFNQADTILAEIGLYRHIQKPDWDNIGKKYTDMFNGNVWLDDNMITDGEVHKYYSILPRVEIYIRYLNHFPNYQQYSRVYNRADYNSNTQITYLNKKGEPVGG